MWHDMLEWLVIYLLNELALYLCKGGLFFEFIKRNSKIALPIILGKQTNYKLYIHYTVHYTVHYEPYRPELSTPETSQERGHMWEMLLWLMSRLGLISTLGKLDSIFITFKNCC